ncbi:MAG: ABC transporter substrate-binding protein [Devosia sp.]
MNKHLIALALAFATHLSVSAAEPIKIGVLTVDSGPFSFLQSHYIDPAKLAVEEINKNGGLLGRPVELVMQSHAGTPATALAAVARLTQQEKVQFVTGFLTTGMSMAVAPRIESMNALLLDGSASGDDLTTKTCFSNYFRSMGTDSMVMNVLRPLIQKSGAKTWSVIASDFATGHTYASKFEKIVEDSGGSIQTKVFAPLGTADFGSQVAQLAAKPADGLAVFVMGSDGITLAKQQQQFGLFKRFKTVVSSHFTNEISLPAQGDSTVGVFDAQTYSPEFPAALNTAFVGEYRKRFNRPPSYVEAETYQVFELFRAAVLKAQSADVQAVRRAMSGLKTATIFGDVEMRAADHQLVRPMALLQIEASGAGKGAPVLRNIVAAADVTPAPVLNCN